MRTETKELYFADDGTPFEQNMLACIKYDHICAQYKEWLRSGKVMFWSKEEQYLNYDLIEYEYQNNTNYLDWLKNRLNNIGFIVIDSQEDQEDWQDIWEFVISNTALSTREQIKIPIFYEAGDLLAFDCQDCLFHNMSLVIRNATACDKRLKENLVKTFRKEVS